eukprot:3385022-Alexandrium_andersonii.AAC.1
MAVEISRQFSTSWSTVDATAPTARHPLLPSGAVVERGTDGACGWNAAAVALQCLSEHVQPETLLPKAAGLGKGLRATIKKRVASGKFGGKYLKDWKPDLTATEHTGAGKPATTFQAWADSSARPGKFVDGLCLSAMARRLQRRIVLVDHAFTAAEVLHAFGPGTQAEI